MVTLSAFLSRLTEIEQEHPTYRIGGMARDEYTPVFAREVSRLPYEYEEPKEEKEQTDQKP